MGMIQSFNLDAFLLTSKMKYFQSNDGFKYGKLLRKTRIDSFGHSLREVQIIVRTSIYCI